MKGRNYGTICVDLEWLLPLALLPNRSPDTIAAWLQAHAGLEIIARDHSGGYVDGAIRGAEVNACAERWVRSVREESLHHLFIVEEAYLWRVLTEYIAYFNHARPGTPKV